jgi:hypothetical protein
MRSEKQREASRTNGAKSRGPKTPGGKDKSKMNGLKHGLRAEQVVLPGEDPAEFRAELKGWADDWKPAGHTRAILVERAAVASWRLRRCVRAEAELIRALAAEAVADDRDDDDDIQGAVDVAEDLLRDRPDRALRELKASRPGVDRLVARWDGLAAAGPMAAASHRLPLANGHDDDDDGDAEAEWMTDEEADELAAGLRRGIASEREALRDLRRGLVAPPSESPEPAADARFVGVTPELMLLHRYEMALDRSLRGTIKDLMALEKARPDLGRAADVETEVVFVT